MFLATEHAEKHDRATPCEVLRNLRDSLDAREMANKVDGLDKEVGNIKLVKTTLGKLLHSNLVAAYKQPSCDLFLMEERSLRKQLNDCMTRRPSWAGYDLEQGQYFDPAMLTPQIAGGWQTSIQNARQKTMEHGFNPDAFGMH